ncbi:DUF4440 domain-containing protein [Pararcticibacter amylolyticus]|uniref:DUF4440 domain-containing protein n=2 Tax=Pararcticibacter amylolyticus TaxID=2173175 RepID=A0A2U2PLK0_9SPHI|nr:DUF4440 domain-containing protein [Pararcticibacter amylolyticus]
MIGTASSQTANAVFTEKIIALEKAALEKWNTGDPAGYLELSAENVSYFDPYLEARLDGLPALKQYYAPIKGTFRVSRYEMLNPKVVSTDKMAVLTFNLNCFEEDKETRWNCTEVYLLQPDSTWKIVQTHWSLIKPLGN